MAEPDPWAALPHRWLHIQLPGYRGSEYHTYEASRLGDLPPIPITLDDECDWLMEHGTPYPREGLNQYERDIRPVLVESLATNAGVVLPRSFCRFMSSPELQSRVRSCTDCYLDPGERVLETTDSICGCLVHFLSDSQSVAHWYLHILPSGQSAVLESEDLYCYQIEHSGWIENPACRLERIDLAGQDFAVCAPSFSEFLYRFWIENELWYALEIEGNQHKLNYLQTNYLEHYSSKVQAKGDKSS